MELTGFFFGPLPDYEASTLVPKKGTPEAAKQILEQAKSVLQSLPEPWTHEEWEARFRQLATDLGLKAGDVF